MISRWMRVAGIVAVGAPVLASASGTDALSMADKPAPLLLAAGNTDLPLSREGLFDVPPAADKNDKTISKKTAEDLPESKDSLFGVDSSAEQSGTSAKKNGPGRTRQQSGAF